MHRGLRLTDERIDHGIRLAGISERLGFGYVPLLIVDGAPDYGRGILFGSIVRMEEYHFDRGGWGASSGEFMAILPLYEGAPYVEIPKGMTRFVVKGGSLFSVMASAVKTTLFPVELKKFENLYENVRSVPYLDPTSQSRLITMVDNGMSSEKINKKSDIKRILDSTRPGDVASMDKEVLKKRLVHGVRNGFVAQYTDGSSHKMFKRIIQVPMWSIDDFGAYIHQRTLFGRYDSKRVDGDLFVAQKISETGGKSEARGVYEFKVYSMATGDAEPIDTVVTREYPGRNPREFIALGSAAAKASQKKA